MVWKFVSGFCVATVLTQLLVMIVLVARGNLSGDSALKMIALANGIDISGNRLQEILDASREKEIPSYDDVLAQRALMGTDMDIKLQSQKNFYEQLQVKTAELREKERRFDTRRNSFNEKLDELQRGVQEEGLRSVQRSLEDLDPAKAKTQLLMMIAEGETDKLVNIVQIMSPEKRKRIFNEFNGADDEKKLAEILRRIGEGEPKRSLIEDARNDG